MHESCRVAQSLRAQLPVRAALRLHEIVVPDQHPIDRQLADLEHASGATADQNGPLRSRRLPVGGDDGGTGDHGAAIRTPKSVARDARRARASSRNAKIRTTWSFTRRPRTSRRSGIPSGSWRPEGREPAASALQRPSQSRARTPQPSRATSEAGVEGTAASPE